MALAKSIIVCVFLFVVVVRFVEALSSQPRPGTLKTIYTQDDDVFDCVDIYKQPSFDHPLLENEKHKIPELLERFQKDSASESENDTEDCPVGTVPIIRFDQPSDNELLMMRNMKGRHWRNFNDTSATSENLVTSTHEHAILGPPPGPYYGVKASVNVWKPLVANSYEFSLAQFWVFSGKRTAPDSSVIEAGWQIAPFRHYNDQRPRMFVYWTSDNYRSTGCYDLDCQGFTLIGKKPHFAPGSVLRPWSIYNSKQYEINIAIQKDQNTGDWFLYVNNYVVGYWPGQLFKDLSEFADGVEFGGEIINERVGGHHTTTQMGSGHPASEGYRKAAYFRKIQVMRRPHDIWLDPSIFYRGVTNPNCYSVIYNNVRLRGVGFFYGGNGYSDSCQ